MTELWAIHVGGCDDIYAAPSEAAAHAMAEKHNQCLKSDFCMDALNKLGLTFEDCQVRAVPWPFEPEEHEEDMKDFDYEKWELERS